MNRETIEVVNQKKKSIDTVGIGKKRKERYRRHRDGKT